MIIKLLGMGIVFVSSCAIGFCLGECFVSREKELKNIYTIIEHMQRELGYTMLPVRELIIKVAPRAKGASANLMDMLAKKLQEGKSPSEAWSCSLEKKAPAMSLKKSDCQVLQSLGYLFEAYEYEEQQSNFERIKDEVSSLIDDASKSCKKNLRLVRMLGVYGGALLCVIMF